MEKLLFLFPRKEGLTREEFFEHYLDVHAPLGLSVTQTMVHYAVNLRDGHDHAPDGVDAFTETWTESVADFMDPAKSFATPEDARRLMTDHDSFIGAPFDVYAVAERVRKGVERPPPTRDRTRGTRVVVAITGDGAEARLAGLLDRDGVVRYVDNDVASAMATDAFGPHRAFVLLNLAPEDGLVGEIESLVGDDGAVYRVSEYVQK
ncbi:MAG TPA: EthD domain-containing protein [Acidimicrobiia bacterium]|nr:EthD domain-containing protein [Acidimicrobiia bacterium]